MILGDLNRSILFEAQMPVQQQEPPAGGFEDGSDGLDANGDPTEFTPLKKYYLVQKLYNLKSKLELRGIENNDLDLVLKFCNELSYETLVRLSTGIISFITAELSEVSNGKRK